MAKPRKLKSGMWNVEVFIGRDKNGKRIRQSITKPTKAQCALEAAKIMARNDRKKVGDLTVKEAVRSYIDSNYNTLSPTSIRGYEADLNRMAPIHSLKITAIKSEDIQVFIDELGTKYAPKTIKNTYTTLITSLTFSGIETRFKINLPTIPVKPLYAPKDEQIALLYDKANPNLKKAIILAAFHSLRRGEICGLVYGDLNGNELYIHSDVVKGAKGGWVHKKTPKTPTSNRIATLTDKEVEILGTGSPKDYIVPITPETLDRSFAALRKRVGLPDTITLQSMRSYFTSIGVILNIPDIYISHMSGHKENSPVLKEHYQKKFASIDEAYRKRMNDYFGEMID